MSRGIKDLRDLICVSRLTVRESDDEYSGSDDDFRPDTALSFAGPYGQKRVSSASSNTASDSGIGPNISPDGLLVQEPGGAAGDVSDSSSTKKKKRKKKKKKVVTTPTTELNPIQVSPSKLPVLPPVANISKISSDAPETSNFDSHMKHIQPYIVADMLQRSNTAVQRLSYWCRSSNNWIQFANFWLNSFPEQQRVDIIQLEYSCLVDELCQAFVSGLDKGLVTIADLNSLVQAVLREYPAKLLGARGSYLFLDYLDILSNQRSSEYKKLLTDVKLSTQNREYAQWYLAIRSFGLVNIWAAIIRFFEELVMMKTLDGVTLLEPPPSTTNLPPEIPLEDRIYQVIKFGYTEVLHYFIRSEKINPVTYIDKQNRNLVFLAVTSGQHRIMRYLLKMDPSVPVECVSDSGNTPMHAAVTSGDLDLIAMLVEVGHADVNCVNENCDNSTPLHLAVIYENAAVVSYLLEHGADPHRSIGDQSCLELARDLGHTYIHELMVRHDQEDALTPRADDPGNSSDPDSDN